jgi:hypothetical protein
MQDNQPNNSYTIWGLIKYLFNLIIGILRGRKQEIEKKQETAKSDINKQYAEIDKQKDENKKQDLDKRLGDMF